MSAPEDQAAVTAREAADQALEQQTKDDAQDALQEALDAHRAMRHAQIAFDQALALRDSTRQQYVEACAKLLPFRKIANEVAA